jgi:hypothetical protein
MSQTIPNSRLDRSHIAPVTTREELIYLLSRAAELEHGLACIYLFAAYSLKSDVSEGGMTDEQATMVRGWRRFLSSVAVEEMGHLAQVSNLLTAIGGAHEFSLAALSVSVWYPPQLRAVFPGDYRTLCLLRNARDRHSFRGTASAL